MNYEERIKELNEIGKAYWEIPKEDIAVKQTYKNKLWIAISNFYLNDIEKANEEQKDIYGLAMELVAKGLIEKYDYTKNSKFAAYMQYYVKNGKLNEYNKVNKKIGKSEKSNSKSDEQINKSKRFAFLSKLTNDDGDTISIIDIISSRSFDWIDEITRYENNEVFLANVCHLLSLILNFSEHKKGRANNPVKLAYYKMFFTDIMCNIIRDIPDTCEMINYNDVSAAMDFELIDFVATQKCRTIWEISNTALKLYDVFAEILNEIAPETKKGKQIKFPLNLIVYRAYMKQIKDTTVTDSAISLQKDEYKRTIKAILAME